MRFCTDCSRGGRCPVARTVVAVSTIDPGGSGSCGKTVLCVCSTVFSAARPLALMSMMVKASSVRFKLRTWGV